MGNYTILGGFENARRGRQATKFNNKCSKNSRSQIVFRTDIFQKSSWVPLNNIQEYATKCDKDPIAENLNNLEILQTDYDRQYDYIAQGAMRTKITSKLVWTRGKEWQIFFEFRIFKEEKELD